MRNIFLVVFLAFTCSLSKSLAQEENFIAVSIYNFTRYMDWPTIDAKGDFSIDVIGHKSVYEKLKELVSGRKVGNRNIAVHYLETANAYSQSQIVFLGFWQSKEMSKIIEKIGSSHTLIISEKDGMIDAGSGINFVIRNSVIKFEIKKANIQKYGLNVTDALVNLAYKSY